jgi:phospholipase/carboxylesterase
MNMLKDTRLIPAQRPERLVIMLHGVGANKDDLIGLGAMWQRAYSNAFAKTAFLSPDGVEAYDMAPMGRQWFSLRDRSASAMEQGAKKAAPALHAYIDAALSEFNLQSSQCALLGFSQGTMMALYAGLRRPQKLAGILGFSGAMIGLDDMTDQKELPVCLIHGRDDSVVPAAASSQAARLLREKGCDVNLHLIDGLDHGIDDQGLALGASFLQRILK